MRECSSTMNHLLFVPSFLWEGSLETLDLDSKRAAWLLAVPISEAEYRFAEHKGVEKLEDVFEKNKIDIYSINGPSVV